VAYSALDVVRRLDWMWWRGSAALPGSHRSVHTTRQIWNGSRVSSQAHNYKLYSVYPGDWLGDSATDYTEFVV